MFIKNQHDSMVLDTQHIQKINIILRMQSDNWFERELSRHCPKNATENLIVVTDKYGKDEIFGEYQDVKAAAYVLDEIITALKQGDLVYEIPKYGEIEKRLGLGKNG